MFPPTYLPHHTDLQSTKHAQQAYPTDQTTDEQSLGSGHTCRVACISSWSSHKFQAARISVYDLTAARTEPCSTPHTCVVCRTTTD